MIDRLVEDHFYLVELTVVNQARFGFIDEDELRSLAMRGLLDAARAWDGNGTFDLWARLKMRYVILAEVKKRCKPKRQHSSVSLDHPDLSDAHFLDQSAPSPSAEADWSALHAAVAKLPLIYRHVIQWRYFEGLKLQEIADRVDMTEGRACQLAKEALAKLRAKTSCLVEEPDQSFGKR